MTFVNESNTSGQLNEHVASFFLAELRNERNGGISPSTLFSAADSLQQAPHEVIVSWFGCDGPELVRALTEFAWMLATMKRNGTTLRELLS